MSKAAKRTKAPKGCFWRGDTLYGRVQIAGGDVKWSLRTGDPKIAAARRKAERERQVAIARYGDARRSFAEAMDAWAGFIVRQVSPKTVKRYTSSLAVLAPKLEGLYLDEITRDLVSEIVRWRREPTIPSGKKHPILPAIATIKRDLTALSSVLDYCVDEGWRDDNPVLAWLKPGGRRKSRLKERRDPIVLPDPAHIEMVIARAPGLLATMIRVAVTTGARLEELVNADRAHVDRDRRQLTVIGKRNKLRVIALEDEAGDLGWQAVSTLPVSLETKALFWHRRIARRRAARGQQPARRFRQLNFGRLVRAVARQAQKQDQDFRPFTFHHLRHRAAVDWLKSGRSIYTLQQRLGHTSIKTTEIYLAFLTPEEKQRVMFGTGTGSKTGSGATVFNASG